MSNQDGGGGGSPGGVWQDQSAGASPFRLWLTTCAGINAQALPNIEAVLEAQDVYDLVDLRQMMSIIPLEDVLSPLTASRIRAALAATPHQADKSIARSMLLPSPPPSPPPAGSGGSAIRGSAIQQETCGILPTQLVEVETKKKDPPKLKGGGMDLRTAMHAMRLSVLSEEIAGFEIPWFIIDPTGDVIRKQRHKRRKEQKGAAMLKELREADEDGNGTYDMDEVRAYSEKQRRQASIAAIKKKKRSLPQRIIARVQAMIDDATLYPAWDVLTAVALLFTAAMTPFEVGFLPPAASVGDPLFIVNRSIDFIFVIDMCFQFFLMYETKVYHDGLYHTQWEVELRPIAKRYLNSPFFWIDVCSIAPSIVDIVTTAHGQSENAPSALKSLRTLRVLRLIKLLRLVKASKVVARLSDQLSLQQKTMRLFKLFCAVLLLLHAFACILGIAATFPTDESATWLTRLGYCTRLSYAKELLADDSFEIIHPKLINMLNLASARLGVDMIESNDESTDPFVCVPPEMRYLACLYWGFNLLTGGESFIFRGPLDAALLGLGGQEVKSFATHSTMLSAGEQVLVIVLKVLGAFVWSIIFGELVVSLTSGTDPVQASLEQGLDRINCAPGTRISKPTPDLHATRPVSCGLVRPFSRIQPFAATLRYQEFWPGRCDASCTGLRSSRHTRCAWTLSHAFLLA